MKAATTVVQSSGVTMFSMVLVGFEQNWRDIESREAIENCKRAMEVRGGL
jgi:hypothetical protein